MHRDLLPADARAYPLQVHTDPAACGEREHGYPIGMTETEVESGAGMLSCKVGLSVASGAELEFIAGNAQVIAEDVTQNATACEEAVPVLVEVESLGSHPLRIAEDARQPICAVCIVIEIGVPDMNLILAQDGSP